MMKHIKYLFLLMFIIILTGCNQNVYSRDFFYMDTAINVRLYNISKEKSEELFIQIDNIFKECHILTDRYNNYDKVNIYYLNNTLKINEKIEIDKKLYDMINYGLNAYKLTDGRVNIAIGNAIDLWRKSEEKQILPIESEIKKVNNNIEDIILEDGYYLKKSDVNLDLGSFAKGYVTEIISDLLLKNNVKSYIINSGGNVKVGEKNSNKKFNIGIENPDNSGNIIEVVKEKNISVVTSGSYERFYNIKDKKYSHILDSITLKPSNNMKSVTIVTKDSARADILSTYLYQLTVENALNYANNTEDVEVLIIDNNNEKHYSRGFNHE